MKMGKKPGSGSAILPVFLSVVTCMMAVGIVLLSVSDLPAASSATLNRPPAVSAPSLPGQSEEAPSSGSPSLEKPPSEAPSSLPESSRYDPVVPVQGRTLSSEGNGMDFAPEERAALDAMLEEYPANISVYFEDVDSGAVYSYHADQHYYVASLIKAPYCLYLYTLADQGKCDLWEPVTVFEEDKQPGTGIIKDMEDLPKDFTVRELMSLAIRESDNTAMYKLLKKYPAAGYAEFAAPLNISHKEDIKYVVNGQISAAEAGGYLKELYQYMETGPSGGRLKSDMQNTKYYMIQTGYPMARKYGWTAGEGKAAYHDMAVVYTPHPYLLAICSDYQDGTAEQRALFGKISQALETIWLSKYSQAGL